MTWLLLAQSAVPPRMTPEAAPMVMRAILCASAAMLIIGAGVRREAVKRRVRAYLYAPDSPCNLAVMRIIVFSALGMGALTLRLSMFARLPPEMRVRLPGWEWLPDAAFPPPPLALGLEIVLGALCAAAAVGLFTRVSTVVATLLAFYVYGMAQMFGKVDEMHHLVWFAALLSASRCGDALSVDARWGRAKPLPTPSVAYGLPLRVAWLLIGIALFFPGWWKLWTCGARWASTTNLRNLFHIYWNMADSTPAFRFDQQPWMLVLGGVGVLTLELSFVFLLFWPRLRQWAALGAVLFLGSVGLFLGPPMIGLTICFLTFVDGSTLLGCSAPSVVEADEAPPRLTALRAVAAVLIAANVMCGALHLTTWPFTVYPPFDSLYPPRRPVLRVYVVHAGREHAASASIGMNPIRWNAMGRVALASDDARREHVCRHLARIMLRGGLAAGPHDAIRFYREVVWMAPEKKSEPSLERNLLLELESDALEALR